MIFRLALCASMAMSSSFFTSEVFAQGTRADYERAASLPARFANRVFRASIAPHWSENGDSFWYRLETAPRKWEFVRVDARAGTRRSAFDAPALAGALGQQLGRAVAPDNLPFSWIDIAPDGSWVRFRADNTVFEWRNGELRPSNQSLHETALAPISQPHPSRRTGENTALTFDNRTARDVQLLWIAPDGTRTPYALVKAGTSFRQNTFGGHVWLVVEAANHAHILAIYEASDAESIALIEERAAQKPGAKAKIAPAKPVPAFAKTAPATPVPAFDVFARDFNLWRRDRQTQVETRLTRDGTAKNYYEPPQISPDNRFFAAMQTRPAQEHKIYEVESSPSDQIEPKLHTLDYLKPGDQIEQPRPRLFDLTSGEEIKTSDALFKNPWSIESLGWDGDNFRFLWNERGHQNLRIIEMNAKTGTVRALVEEHSGTFIDYSSKTFYKLLPSTNELLWASERDGRNQLFLFDTRSGQLKNKVTNGDFVVRSVERVDETARQIWFRGFGLVAGQDPYYSQLARVNFDGSGLTILTGGDGEHRWKWSPDRRFLLDTWSRVDKAPQTVLRDGQSGQQLCALETSDLGELEGAGWTRTERFSAPGRDGKTEIFGVIVRPSNFDAARKYPVIEQIYAGPQDFYTPKAFDVLTGLHQLADLGFVVVQLDGMGTNWRSKSFHDLAWKNLKDAGFPDRIAWMKAAAQSRPWMDLERVGIYGGSAGGQNALAALLWHGDFYKAAVADCGCHDNRMDKIWWNEQWMGWPVDKSYADSSNVDHAAQMTGHLQLVVGELDSNVDPASTMQVANALIKADKDFELLVIPGANHGAGGGAYGTRRRNDFFVRNLLGVEPRRP